jgi:hypothetical protein
MAYACIDACIDASIDIRKKVFTMSALFNLIAFVLMSLTVLATPSLRQNGLMISGQRRKAAAKNEINFDKVEQSINMVETQTNSSVASVVASQRIASGYFVDATYADAACSIVTTGSILPLGLCMSMSPLGFIYTYSSVDKTVSLLLYDNIECTGEGYLPYDGSGTASRRYFTVEDTCDSFTSLTEPIKTLYSKNSVIPSISALNTAIFLVR